ncbi:NAD(P)/FAD-dependent oxidoreductase [Enterococcus saccharolyticus]|uniref:Pyridine nucleotide-disulfide family oxidoreductase n=1 Tax=Enterococcus saccharolyticus subsp. saccharolyticus ATCC 43076 TaxID=1139996 RepID=S0JE12_9ENTE|nr:NAD(P)/FAD-dependent oxidoreductase [Enterococcus saccharolyticus]EOT25953.1 pyridine nucleotide-disulfide family oxidoreductase [Enterococcus saccharolyticus subsp. saccharolyticus ATCC 43076]EOT82679.1 pyridine nucleotide-disulfide family oxidoreductase [Enterococcus saccharolyticus subsp. saccharolyticus ATCC 43076]OJG91047.1 pyridine nucleotide-disulfide family oxidoreductase [Enterococcus saccharolyticus]
MKEVAILGAGYAGLRALHELQKKAAGEFRITLVDRNAYHYEATDLHEVAAGTQPKEKITYDIKDVVNPKVTTFIQDEVVKINPDTKEVELKNNKPVRYDYLIIGLGFRSETFGIPGAEENALEMVNIDSAVKIYEHIQDAMAKYKETKDKKYLKLVVCGAGFTGIELVGSLVEAKKGYAKLAGVTPDEIEIYCVEAAPTILPMFNDELTNYCLKQLDKWNVHLMTGCAIKGIKPEHVVYANGDVEKELEAATIIWTTGVSGSFVMGESGFDERRGRVVVNEDLTAPGHDDIYIIGDVAAVMDKESNRPYPTTAQIALKMGEYTAKHLVNRIKGQSTPGFVFKSAGSVASIGNTHAFGMVGKTGVKGYPASFIKKMIMNKSLYETGGVKEVMAKGRFDLYH